MLNVLSVAYPFAPVGPDAVGGAEQSSCSKLLRRGFERAEIGVERDNPRALRLYERLGYEHLTDVVEFYTYRTPGCVLVRATADQWLLRKRLLP